MYKLYYTYHAKKDFQKIKNSKLKDKCLELLKLIEQEPFRNPPAFKKLQGSYKGMYSRRINLQHRLFYEVDEMNKRIKVLRMWTLLW